MSAHQQLGQDQASKQGWDTIGVLRFLSVLCIVAGVLTFVAPAFMGYAIVPRQYYPFVDHTIDLAVTDQEARVLENAEEKDAAELAILSGRKKDTLIVSARVIYERAINYRRSGRRGHVPFDPSYRQPTFEERDGAGPEHHVHVELSTTDIKGPQVVRKVWPNQNSGSTTSSAIPMNIEPLPEEIATRVLPVLSEYISTAFAVPELTEGVRAGGTRGPELPKPTSGSYNLLSVVIVALGVIGLRYIRRPTNETIVKDPSDGNTTLPSSSPR